MKNKQLHLIHERYGDTTEKVTITQKKGIQTMDKNGMIKKPLPILYEKKENCCGCTACYSICPTDAISMQPDEEGFLYPVVNEGKCVTCYMCLKVCAFKEAQRENGYL